MGNHTPCDTVVRMQVQFLATTTDKKLLAKGLRAHGYNVQESSLGLVITKDGQTGTYRSDTGRLELPRNWDSQEFKRAYSEQVVEKACEEHGWKFDWKTNEQGDREAEVEKDV